MVALSRKKPPPVAMSPELHQAVVDSVSLLMSREPPSSYGPE
jgi:hypothetical protein